MPNGGDTPHSDSVPDSANPSMWDRLDELPTMDEQPLDAPWMSGNQPPAQPLQPVTLPPAPVEVTQAQPLADQRQFLVPAPVPSTNQPAGPVSPPPVAPQQRPHPSPGPLPLPRPHTEPQAPSPSPAPGRTPRKRTRSRRARRGPWRTIRRMIVLLLVFGLLAALGGGFYLRRTWNDIERVALAEQLSPASDGFTNYLIVGTDSRSGLDGSLESAGDIGLGVSGERSDTMVLLQRSGSRNTMMAIPRDLFVQVEGVGPERINAAVAFGGPQALVATVQSALNVPVHHYLEVDLAGFLDVVDALGGVTIDFPCPVTDPKSGLDITMAGTNVLDAEGALAYVRARTYVETCPGQPPTPDGRADLGRVERQQVFLNAVFAQVASRRNPYTLLRVAGGVGSGLAIDDALKLTEALRLGRAIESNPPQTVVLPTFPFTTNGGAQVLDLATGAQDILDQFRG